MKSTLFAAMLSVLILPSLASAQNPVSGNWAGELQGSGTSVTVLMGISADDSRISGSIIAQGQEMSIQEATQSGALVEFTTTEQRDGAEVKFKWTGNIAADGNEITFSVSAPGSQDAPTQLTVHRQTPQ